MTREYVVGRWRFLVRAVSSADARPSVDIRYDDGGGLIRDVSEITHIEHTDLRDLRYGVDKAMRLCRGALGPNHKHEI